MVKYTVKWMMSICGLLACGIQAHAQKEIADSIQKQFTRNQAQTLQEKIFVHTDKNFYLAGEIIWFRIYDVDGNFNKPLDLSSISYVEIVSGDQKPVLQARVGMQDGKGNGSLMIPASIVSGNYVIRAYTSWMKNFSPELYFRQPITIVNTLNNTENIQYTPARAYNIQFFPEGGSLVSELTSRVAFKAVNEHGSGVMCKGVVLNQKKDTVAYFKTSRFGMGNFSFTPKKGEEYFSVVELKDTVIIQKLPSVHDSGYVMSLDEAENGQIKISVHCNVNYTNPGIYLFVHTRQAVGSVQSGFVTHNEASFYVDKKNLGDGISHFTIFTADRTPVCERLYFKQPVNRLQVEAKADQAEYSARNKVNIDITSKDQSGKALKADMSLSVFLIDSLQDLPKENIFNYLMLSAELKGEIESPEYYFENTGPEVMAAADNLMLTQGWSRFRWEDILHNKNSHFEFLTEREGPVLNGKITDKRTGLPAPNTPAYLSVPGKYFELSSATSNADGNVRFTLKKFYGNNEIVVQTNNQTDSNFRVDIENPFSDKFATWFLPALSISQKNESQLVNRSINAQVENTYQTTVKRRFSVPQIADTTPFYGKPDLQYRLDDYTRYQSVEEVMHEYIADVRIRKESGKYNFRVKNSLYNIFFDDDPLLLVDGVPVFDANKLMAVDPLKIKAVDIISRKYYLGPMISDGIVSYKTYEGDLSGYQLDANALLLQYNGLQQNREFYQPVYESKSQIASRMPDFRNVLCWIPDLQSDTAGKKQLSFYTSDFAGKYALIINGLTDDGLAGSGMILFNVNKKAPNGK